MRLIVIMCQFINLDISDLGIFLWGVDIHSASKVFIQNAKPMEESLTNNSLPNEFVNSIIGRVFLLLLKHILLDRVFEKIM